jgi:hypothetical protein
VRASKTSRVRNPSSVTVRSMLAFLLNKILKKSPPPKEPQKTCSKGTFDASIFILVI